MAEAGGARHASVGNGDEEICPAATEQDRQHRAHKSLIASPAPAAEKMHKAFRTQMSGVIPVRHQEAPPQVRQLQLNRRIDLRLDGRGPAVKGPVRLGFR